MEKRNHQRKEKKTRNEGLLSFQDLTHRRWSVLVACCLVNLCLGSLYSWSVFASSMAPFLSQKTGANLTAADLAIVYTIANAVGPVTMISGGWFNDKFGHQKVILTGGIMFGLGMFLSGFATSIGSLILTYGILCGLGIGMSYGTAISSCVKFFPDKRGLIGGITTAVYGGSSVILPPVITVLVSKTDASFAFKFFGTLFFIIICICSFFIIKCPEGFVPEGYTAPVSTKGQSRVQDMDFRGMLRTGRFYIMIFLLTCGAFCGMMIISQASAVAVNLVGMTPLLASTSVSVLALFNAAGRIAAGWLSDRIGRITTLCSACILSAAGMLCLIFTHSGNIALFFGGVSIVGLCFGSFMGVFPGFTADQFGTKNNSVNYGIMFIGFALAGFFGPTVMKNFYQSDGSYTRAFITAAILSIAGMLLTFVYRALDKKRA